MRGGEVVVRAHQIYWLDLSHLCKRAPHTHTNKHTHARTYTHTHTQRKEKVGPVAANPGHLENYNEEAGEGAQGTLE